MIAIIDYGMGNLRSVQKAFERQGHSAEITRDARQLEHASHLVLPGVGAFADAMHELSECRLIEPILAQIAADKPFLGICLGLQLLFETGHEDGCHRGLGVLAGEVVRFPARPGLKVPHMGWNELLVRRPAPLLAGLEPDAHMYFVHSYYVVPRDEEVIAVQADYGGLFTAMIWRRNLFACQFHPEKSQAQGLRILDNFARLPAPA